MNSKKQHIEIENEDLLSEIPREERELLNDQLWSIISSTLDNDFDKSVIEEAVIRDGTYESDVDEESGSRGVTFLLDIDSIKQTYAISIVWSDDEDKPVANSVYVNCPPQDQMKYPETVCHGMYNNTYSLDLYLPYSVYPESGDGAPNYMINGDEANKTIDIMVSACDAEKYKQQAMDYLRSTPIKLDEYTINYEVNSVDIDCGA